MKKMFNCQTKKNLNIKQFIDENEKLKENFKSIWKKRIPSKLLKLLRKKGKPKSSHDDQQKKIILN